MYCVCVVVPVPVVKCLRFYIFIVSLSCRNHKIKYALHFMWMLFLVTKTKEVKGWVDGYKL